jgi:hypothetical protein
MELVARKILMPQGSQTVVLAPLGDIQWAGRKEQIAHQRLKDHIARATDLGAWWIGMGDYIDYMSPGNRQRTAAANLYDTAQTVQMDKAKALVDELYEEYLKPLTGRVLGLLEGHHFYTLETGETTDQYLCSLLKAPFLGTSAILGLAFPTHCGVRMVEIWCHHGVGGGQKAHAPIMKLENAAAYWQADIFLIGHMSKRGSAPIQRTRAVWNVPGGIPVLRDQEIHLVGTGAWLKGYPERSRVGKTPRGGYVEQKMLNPVSLGAPLIYVTPKTYHEQTGRMKRTVKGHRVSDTMGRLARYWIPEIRVET